MTPLLFSATDGQRFKLDAAAVEVLRQYAQHGSKAPEAGGVLVGRHIDNSLDVVVDTVTSPMRGDIRLRHSFFRSRKPHQRRIDELHAQSGGTCVYLGEWHTHAEPSPTPSPTDLADWRRRLRADRVDAAVTFFVIVGMEEIRAWRGLRPSAGAKPLPPEPLVPGAGLPPSSGEGPGTTEDAPPMSEATSPGRSPGPGGKP